MSKSPIDDYDHFLAGRPSYPDHEERPMVHPDHSRMRWLVFLSVLVGGMTLIAPETRVFRAIGPVLICYFLLFLPVLLLIGLITMIALASRGKADS